MGFKFGQKYRVGNYRVRHFAYSNNLKPVNCFLNRHFKHSTCLLIRLIEHTTHVETCVLLYHKDYTVGEKGKKVTVEVGMNK